MCLDRIDVCSVQEVAQVALAFDTTELRNCFDSDIFLYKWFCCVYE